MAQFIDWGNGHDGSPNSISGTINTYATMTGTSGSTTVTTNLSVDIGDLILLIQSQGSGVGNWEVVHVVSTGSGSFTADRALVNSYGTGAQAVLIPQYTSGTISKTLTTYSWDGSVGGIGALACNGPLLFNGIWFNTGGDGSSFSSPGGRSGKGTGGGFRGGDGYTGNNDDGPASQGEGTSGYGTYSRSANGNGGGAGGDGTNAGSGAGGGNGTDGNDGNGTGKGTKGASAGNAELTNMVFGGGGGGGSKRYSYYAAGGGSGGGIILLFVKELEVSSSATITVSGGKGGTTPNHGVAGGGGAGGSILIKCHSANLGSGKVWAAHGEGGLAGANGLAGGNGALGRIHCDYYSSVTGETYPDLDSKQDSTLTVPSGGFFAFM